MPPTQIVSADVQQSYTIMRLNFPRNTRTCLATIAAIAFAACSGSDGGGTGPLPIASVEVITIATTFEVGQSVQFAAVTRDKNGSPVPPGVVQWSVAPATIATVNSSGVVSLIAAGSATVTAIAGGISGSSRVTVVDNGIPFTATVFMPGNAFSPFNVTIHLGGTVKWEFPAEQHDVTFVKVAGAPADITVRSSTTVSRVFSALGTFSYECMVHPGMTGQVTVVP